MPYPSTIGSFTNPSASNKLNSPSHSSIETAQNTALTEIQTFVGTEASTVGTLFYNIRAAASNGGGHIQSANKGGTGQTAYTKGDLIVATSASVLAKLAVGSDAQALVADSTTQAGLKWATLTTPTAVQTVIPLYVGDPTSVDSGNFPITSSSVLAVVSLQNVPAPIVVNKISFQHGTGGGGAVVQGFMRVGLYKEDGTASIFAVNASIISMANAVINTTTVSSVTVAAGNYWLMMASSNGSVTLGGIHSYAPNANVVLGTPSVVTGIGGLMGVIPITAGNLPASFSPSVVSYNPNTAKPIKFRLDN